MITTSNSLCRERDAQSCGRRPTSCYGRFRAFPPPEKWGFSTSEVRALRTLAGAGLCKAGNLEKRLSDEIGGLSD